MQWQYEASRRLPRVLAVLLAPLLTFALASPVAPVLAENPRVEPTGMLRWPGAHPTVSRDHFAPLAVVPARLPVRVIVPRRLPPVAPTQAVSLSLEEANFLDTPPVSGIELQLPRNTKAHVGGWVEMGFGPMSLE